MRLWIVVIILFVAGNLGDVITTTTGELYFDHSIESNPIGIKFNVWLLLGLKILLVSIMLWLMLKKYHLFKNQMVNYFLVYMVVLVMLLNVAVTINNINAIRYQPKDVQITQEQKEVAYDEAVNNLGLLKVKGASIFSTMVIINMLQFLTWRSFEKWKKKKLLNIN